MNIAKVRFIIPGVTPGTSRHRREIPPSGPIVLATIIRPMVEDVLVYAETITQIQFADIYDADIVFISIHTHTAVRGYEIADHVKTHSSPLVVMGGMHASLNYEEAIQHCDYILTGEADESIIDFVEQIAAGYAPTFPGLVYRENDKIIHTGNRPAPVDINTIPDRNLVHGYARVARSNDFIYPIVHGSRGCPYNCSFCAIVKHFGHKVRCRDPEVVVQDIRQAISFHTRPGIPRLNNVLWLTDDNFAHNREWAKAVLNTLIREKIRYNFVVQARVEIGYDQELLTLMQQAGFLEIYLGIEALDDATLAEFNKESSLGKIQGAIANIQQAGIGVHGLFVLGADTDQPGIGRKIARFVIKNRLHGVLLQSFIFIPGTAAFAAMAAEKRLLHRDWHRYVGNVVHCPKQMRPSELQQELLTASKRIYSPRRLLHALLTYPRWMNKLLFAGEYLWQIRERKDMREVIVQLQHTEKQS